MFLPSMHEQGKLIIKGKGNRYRTQQGGGKVSTFRRMHGMMGEGDKLAGALGSRHCLFSLHRGMRHFKRQNWQVFSTDK